MPELPEVEIARRQLVRWLGGRTVTGAEAERTRTFRGGHPARFRRLRGRLRDAGRKGKYLLLQFDDGTGVLAQMGRETTNVWVEHELFADKAAKVGEFFSLPVDTRGPAYASGGYAVTPTNRALRFETVIMPLSTDGGAIDMLLGGLVGEPLTHGERVKAFDYEIVARLSDAES